VLAGAARSLEAAGAQGLVLCTNTLHRVAGAIESAVGIPLLHIVDATASDIVKAGFGTVGLLGTRFTMQQPFYRDRLAAAYGLNVLTPDESERAIVHRIIFEELCLGRLIDASRRECRRIMANLVAAGAQAIILGCTELSALVAADDASVPLFDTTAIHARQAVDWALSAD
jgi:aspartate racemase